jgi:hypothetical protein
MTTIDYASTIPASLPAPTRWSSWPGRSRAASFTLDGNDELERHLEQTCARVLSGIRGLIPERKLEGLFLGGGYGRGEGGVRRDTDGDHPYNDLEFYVAVRGNRHFNELRYRRRLDVLGEILTHLAGLEVEFKITSLAELASRPISMFSYDLVEGHRLLWGGPAAKALQGCEHHHRAEELPAMEATRLLMNRCSGLLLARAELEREPFTPAAADFVRRNIAKAQLAFGDAVLASGGSYRWSCRERHSRLQRLARREPSQWHDALVRHHAAGLEFKLHPSSVVLSREALLARHAEVTNLARQCWIRLESRRLGRAFPGPGGYAEDPINKCPGTSVLRNFILNLRIDGFRAILRPSPWRHPRQRVLHALAVLLWEPTAIFNPAVEQRLGSELNTRASTPEEWLTAYQALWLQVQ